MMIKVAEDAESGGGKRVRRNDVRVLKPKPNRGYELPLRRLKLCEAKYFVGTVQ